MAKLKGKGWEMMSTKPRAKVEKLEEVDLTRSGHETYVALVLDSSGSMMAHYDQAVAGFNRQLAAIRKNVEHDAYVWLCLFGTPGPQNITWPIERGEVADLYDLDRKSYVPYGSTPLLDAVGYTVERLEHDDRYSENQAFLVVAFSDGDENTSRKYSWGTMGALVKSKDERWTFAFIGPKTTQAKLWQAGFKPENMLEWKDTQVKLLMDKSEFALGKFLQARNTGKLLPAYFERDDDA